METARMILLITEIVLIWIVLTAIQFPLRKEEHKIVRSIIFLLKIILIPAVALLFASIEWAITYIHADIRE